MGDKIAAAAQAIKKANAILITTGAGMGVGSGLGTFRGRKAGVWPPLEKLNLDFSEMSNPDWFDKDPNFAWSFWQWRLNAYRGSEPHIGYTILNEIAESKGKKGFSFTSNIDGHWIKCGFDESKVIEAHGSLMYAQCHTQPKGTDCQREYYPMPDIKLEIDENDKAKDPLPKCKKCESLARPNVLMFGDFGFLDTSMSQKNQLLNVDTEIRKYDIQEENYRNWLNLITKNDNLIVIEIGAGSAVPTVRRQSEYVIKEIPNSTLIRINPEEPQIPKKLGTNHISFTENAEDILVQIKELL